MFELFRWAARQLRRFWGWLIGVTLHVATWGDDWMGTGKRSRPFRTVTRALKSVPVPANRRYTVLVAAGVYREAGPITIDIKCGPFGMIVITGVKGGGTIIDAREYSEELEPVLWRGLR